MGYIKDKKHFINYIQKVARESYILLDEEKLMPISMYVSEAYEFADDFCWKLREDITVLHEDNFWDWLRFKKVQGFSMPPEIDQITTEIFHDTLSDLVNIPGVYSFWNKENVCLYVGVSIDLSSRISTSFTERFKHYTNVVYLRYLSTKTSSDAAVLETLLIAKNKPVLNRTSKFDDELTLNYEPPKLTTPIPCNKEGEKKSFRLSHNRFETRLDVEKEYFKEELSKVLKEGDHGL